MLSRWSIEESPTKRDPNRRLLYVKGSLSDVHGLIRKLGAVCGRPKKEKGNDEFNYSLALRKISEEDLSEIESELRSISPNGAVAVETPEPVAKESIPEAAPASDAADGMPIEIALASGQTLEPLQEDPMPVAAAPAPAEVQPAVEVAPAAEPVAEPAPEAVVIKPDSATESEGGEAKAEIGTPIAGLDLSAPGGAAAIATVSNPNAETPPSDEAAPFAGQGPPIAVRSAESAGVSPSTPEPAPLGSGGAADGPSGLDRLASMPLFGGQTERDGSRTLDNFVVGAFNRFAHAGGMSILTSPGTLYQPLFVSGPSGSGKTHLLHALADKLQQQNPDDPIWITSGARIARAAAWAVSTNRFAELEEFANKAKFLIVDDLQFMGIADHNKVQLATIFKIFADAQKQIILSSAYPPEMVVAIEQALEIRITGGHAVELKAPSGEKQIAIAKSAMERCGLLGEETEINPFVEQACLEFNSLALTLRRAMILQGMRATAGQAVGLPDIQGPLFTPDAGEPQVIAAEELETKSKEIPSPGGGKRRLALFYPHGQEAHAEWTLRQVAASANFQAWEWPFADAIRKPYAIDPSATVPFVLAEEAYQAGADAVLVLGPQPGAELAEHEGDCRYVLQHLLADGEVPLGWVSYQRVHDPKYHFHAFLDLQPEPIAGGVT